MQLMLSTQDAFVYPLPTYSSDHVVGILFEDGGVRTFFEVGPPTDKSYIGTWLLFITHVQPGNFYTTYNHFVSII